MFHCLTVNSKSVTMVYVSTSYCHTVSLLFNCMAFKFTMSIFSTWYTLWIKIYVSQVVYLLETKCLLVKLCIFLKNSLCGSRYKIVKSSVTIRFTFHISQFHTYDRWRHLTPRWFVYRWLLLESWLSVLYRLYSCW